MQHFTPKAQDRRELDAQVREALDALVAAQEANAYREVGEGTSRRRIFEDGATVYPLGYDESPIVGCAIMGVFFLASAVVALVMFVDQSVFRWHALGVTLVIAVICYALFRHEDRKQAERVAKLETGTILLPDWLLLASGSMYTVVPRSSISNFRTREIIGGGSSPQPHLYALVESGGEISEVFTGFVNAPNAEQQLRTWLASGKTLSA